MEETNKILLSMDSKTDEGDMSNRQRKFGLPGWMVNNIERLNFVSDFEQYGSSPPEDSFLAEGIETNEAFVTPQGGKSDPYNSQSRFGPIPETRLPPTTTNHIPTPSFNRLEHIRPDDFLFSSPDSTPCATPEPSPVIRRKLSIPHPEDTVQTNPGRWFYMGKFKKGLPPIHPNAALTTESGADAKQKKSAIKLVISNFDLNAVSPNSW